MQFSPSVHCSLQRSLWVWLLYYVYNWKQLTSWIFTFYLVFQLVLTLACHVRHRGRWFGGESKGGCQVIACVANINSKPAPEKKGWNSLSATLSEPEKGFWKALSKYKKGKKCKWTCGSWCQSHHSNACLLYARQCTKSFLHVISFNPHHKHTLLMRQLRLGRVRMRCKRKSWELKSEIFWGQRSGFYALVPLSLALSFPAYVRF